MRFLLVTQKRFHSLVLASPAFLPLTLNELTAFKPNDVMCIKSSQHFFLRKKVTCVLRCSKCIYFGSFIIFFFKKQESGCKLILTFFSICVKHMFRRIEERNCHSLGSFRAIWLPGKLHATILVSKGLTSEFPLPAKNECRSNRRSEGEDFRKWLKILLFCPLQQVASRWWWWKKKGGKGETPAFPSQQLARAKGRSLPEESLARSQLSPLPSLCDAALVRDDAGGSSQSQRCHATSGRSALMIWGLAGTPFQDRAATSNIKIPYAQTGAVTS